MTMIYSWYDFFMNAPHHQISSFVLLCSSVEKDTIGDFSLKEHGIKDNETAYSRSNILRVFSCMWNA